MTPSPAEPTRENFRDALGWLYAALHGDDQGRIALALSVDPVGLVDALTYMYLSLTISTFGGRAEEFLDVLRDGLDPAFDEAGVE